MKSNSWTPSSAVGQAEVPPWSRERPLSEVKRTKSVRKRTCRLECRLSGEEQTLLVRGCQDRS
jgi:hypothetical protein